MVAMLIVATALPALLSLIMTQLDGSAAVREKTFAFWVAENELTRIRMQTQLVPDRKLPDRDSGVVQMVGEEWFWEMTTEATDIENFRRVEITVARSERRGAILASLLGFIDD
jgi:general secretion pathway protein I